MKFKWNIKAITTVPGPVIEIRNSSEGFVYSAGSHINLDCIYRNR